MACAAVIFDLFGTLIENFPEWEYQSVLERVALTLAADRERFIDAWSGYSDELFTGKRRVEESIESVCRRLGIASSAGHKAHAYRIMIDHVRAKMEPSRVILEVLSHLNKSNYRIGLISNCSDEVPVLWEESPLSAMIKAPIFSSSVGMKKPDKRIYLMAAERLGVDPKECLFVDDNLSALEGAAKSGMTPVLVRDVELNKPLIDASGWQGNTISSVREVVHFLSAR